MDAELAAILGESPVPRLMEALQTFFDSDADPFVKEQMLCLITALTRRQIDMTTTGILARAVAELMGNADPVRQALERIWVIANGALAVSAPPTPDPAVMREYVDKLTRFYIDNPDWVRLAEEARGYIGALKKSDA